MVKKTLDKSAARSAVEEIRRRREERAAEVRRRKAEDQARWNAQAERMAARGRAADEELAAARVQAAGSMWGKTANVTQAAPSKAEKQPFLPGLAVETRHTSERGHSLTYQRKTVLCGKKGCNKLHGPYWYAFWSQGGKVRSVYIGKKFRKVEEKCPERLKTAASV